MGCRMELWRFEAEYECCSGCRERTERVIAVSVGVLNNRELCSYLARKMLMDAVPKARFDRNRKVC